MPIQLPGQTPVTSTELLGFLKVPTLRPTNDLQRVLCDGNRIEREALGSTRWLLTDSKFIIWISQRRSNILLVEGHASGYGYGKTSPLSVCFASLALAMTELPQTVSLHYFCGQHIDNLDSVYGPNGLIRSLVLQLLQYPTLPEPDLGFIDPKFLDEICRCNVPALCDLFHILIRQIEETVTISCIIDGVSILEGVSTRQDTVLKDIIRALLAIMGDTDVRAKFKLLLGCENRSTVVVNLIPEANQIALRTAAAPSTMTLASIHSGISGLLPIDSDKMDVVPGRVALGSS